MEKECTALLRRNEELQSVLPEKNKVEAEHDSKLRINLEEKKTSFGRIRIYKGTAGNKM
jgi:hypothetical protein